MQKRRKPSVKKVPSIVEKNDVFISPTYSIETATSMSDMSNLGEMSPRRRLSAAFRAVESRVGEETTENFTPSKETIRTGKDSPQWTAVYPLPSLSNFTKRLLNSHSSNKKKTSSSSEKRPEITANSSESEPLLCTMSPLLAAKQASIQSKHSTSNFGIGSCWLCAARDLPPWHFRHRHVSGGYRQCRTFVEACVSIFQWHNESINIWSHLFGAMLLVRKVCLVSQSLFATVATATPPDDTPITCFASLQDTNLFVVFLTWCMVFGNVVPIASSAFCHTFYGLSPVWHRTCWFVDFVGLMCGVLGITTGYLAILFLSPALAPFFYLAVTVSLVTFAYFIRCCYRVFLPRLTAPVLQPHDRFPEFAGNMAKFSAVNFVLATVATVWFCPQYFAHERLRAVVSSVAVFPVSLVLSLVIFAQGGVPERFSFWWSLPADFFDYLGHSHQWWHVASCTILYLWLDVVQAHFQARWALGCNL